jgi:hypothetical protein
MRFLPSASSCAEFALFRDGREITLTMRVTTPSPATPMIATANASSRASQSNRARIAVRTNWRGVYRALLENVIGRWRATVPGW